ncbi:hypothetical protein [Aquimarina aquimarini]|uniref:hypothetical protein n=1 Tax=Aquimarina aquimarini TaxID=1191734 RepID=UPI000D55D62D|nr:hypothetical protein [Aquimarina aquimarini]
MGDILCEIITSSDITSLWKVTKDQVEICNSCEFRYACPDNRIPIFDSKSNQYYHLTPCKYDPKTKKWNA